ncbi:MAG TPA: alpha/beta fold hydrolase [Beijerinckiaceae bacterium]|jgi:pimeloyl-ACP methyl ester carboxylesterase
MRRRISTIALAALAVVAAVAIGLSLFMLFRGQAGLAIERTVVGSTPATVYRPHGSKPAPAVVVAHGFAGSQPLMAAFATTFARNGFVAVTFDFPGHGRNPRPLPGNPAQEGGTTGALVDETLRVLAFARTLGDGRVALLGHSMASDVVIRAAQQDTDVGATIAVSMFSRTATAASPRNLLVIAGDWEGRLKVEALRVVGLASAPESPKEGITYGDFAAGTARRAAFSPNVEHIGVLFSSRSMEEALGWLEASFGMARGMTRFINGRGPWIVLLLTGFVLLAWPLSRLLPVLRDPPAGAALSGWRLWALLIGPAVLTPLILRVVPTKFLPVLVADYVAAHFALYGLLTIAGLRLVGLRRDAVARAPVRHAALIGAVVGAILYAVVGLGAVIDAWIASFVPVPARVPIILAILAGALPYFLADEWLTRGSGRWAYAASKLAFLLSLALAVGLDPRRLFFLVIIVPAILVLFLIYGALSAWTYRRTGHPAVGAIANAIAFAWALGVTFPLVAS